MAIEESLNLDLGPALASIRGELKREIESIPSTLRETFGDALGGMADDVGAFAELAREEIERVLGAPIEAGTVEVPVEVDTAELDAVPGEVAAAGAPVEVPVEVDASQLDEVEEQIEGLEGETFEVKAEVDAEGIERAAEGTKDLGAAAEESSVNFGNLSNNVGTVVSGIADLGKFTGAGGAIGLLTASAVGFASAAIDSDSATRSFEARVGDLAGTLDRVGPGIAGLNESLADFALRIGADDDALRLALASFIQLGTSSGRSRVELGQLGQQLTAISGYLSVLNPELGSASAIADRLPGAFARGGRALNDFGLSITASAIETRALQDNVGKTTEELTQFDKSAAGLALTFEQLGPKIAAGIDKGVESPAIKLRQLRTTIEETFEGAGADLIDPLIASLTALAPVMVSVAEVVGQTGEGFATVLVPALQIVGPIIEGVSDTLDEFPPVLLAAGVAALLYARHMRTAAAAANEAAAASSAAGAAAAGSSGGIALKLGGVLAVAAAAQAIQAISVEIGISSNAPEITEEFQQLADTVGADVVPAFASVVAGGRSTDLELGRSIVGVKNFGKTYKDEFRDLATQSRATAIRVRDELRAMGKDTSEFDEILAELSETTLKNSEATQEQVAALEAADPLMRLNAATVLKQSLAYEQLDPAIQATVDSIIDLAEEEENAEKKAADLAKAESDLESALADVRQEFEDLNDEVSDSLALYDEMAARARVLRDADMDWNEALLGLNKSVKDNGKDWRIWTEAGIENNRALDEVTDKAAGVIDQIGSKFPTSVDGFNGASAIWRDELVKQAEALGVPKDRLLEIKALIDTLRLNEEVNIRINVLTTAGVNVSRAGLNALGNADPEAVAAALGLSEGGIVEQFAVGGQSEDHRAFIGSGVTRVFDEPETGGEAYIPMSPAKRERSTAILSDVAGEFGFGLAPAGGGGGTAVLERIASLLDGLPARMPAGVTANVDLTVEETDVLARLGARLRGH